ncbi:flagellar basal body-associated protein FliL [Methylovirgula ligni]|nr:flagellar basal body-associated protein FliL [Methylovirgula ligni]
MLIIRHAEKPAGDNSGPGLAPAGVARAKAYVDYLQHLRIDGAPVKIDAIIATADSQDSDRPRLTVTPFAQASGLKIEQPFPDKEVKALAHWLAAGEPHRTVLIAWHHGKMPKLLNQLGANPDELLPDGYWPEDTYDWVILLRYDDDGQLSESKRIIEPAFAD